MTNERSGNKETECAEMEGDRVVNPRRGIRNRESGDEIGELEAELRKAYIAKELRVQLAEKSTERYIEKIRQQRTVKMMRLEQQTAFEMDLRRKTEARLRSEDYRHQLTEQITRKQEEKCVAIEEARMEREILAEVDRIREQSEKLHETMAKNELAESMRRERFIRQEMKEIRNQEEMEAETKKLSEDKEYLREIDRRTEEAKRLRAEQILARERVMCEIAKILADASNEKKKRMSLVAEIMEADVRRELLIKEKEAIVSRTKMRDDLLANLKEQIVFTEQCKLRFLEQDRAFAEDILRKIMDDERTAKLTAAAKRRMQLQYREDLTRMIEERRRIREVEIAKLEEEAKEENMAEMIRRNRIREERKRLLQEHASNVARFLDQDVLSAEEKHIMAKAVKDETVS